MKKIILIFSIIFSISFVGQGAVHFATNAKGQLNDLVFQSSKSTWKVPMLNNPWGTGWYVRNKKGKFQSIKLEQTGKEVNSFSGRNKSIYFTLKYQSENDQLKIIAGVENHGTEDFKPMTAGIKIGFDAYQASYPSWLNKLVPNVIRCEPTHHWGYATSPNGHILAWVCDAPVASWSIDYEYAQHRIYTANIDFINQGPLPSHHPQNLNCLKPGEKRVWTVHFIAPAEREDIRPALGKIGGVPLCESDYSTIFPGEVSEMTVYGPKNSQASLTTPKGESSITKPVRVSPGKTVYALSGNKAGLYKFKVQNVNGKIAEGSIYIRKPWKWYLEKARLEALRIQPTQTHHAECIYPFYSMFLAAKYFPNPQLDAKSDKVFKKIWPLHYNEQKEHLRTTFRIQDTATWIGILSDRYAATDDLWNLEKASHLADFLIDKCQSKKDGGFYINHFQTHYTSVLYLAKSLMEYLKEVKPLVEKSELWKKRYQKAKHSVDRAIADLNRRKGNVQTEGQQTYEDGMIACTITQLAMYALKTDDPEMRKSCTQSAKELFEGHRSLTLNGHPDARVNGATIRFWETQYTICLMHNMYNSPCGWSAWKYYGDYYLYLLTGKEEYLRDAFNGLGACVQLIDVKTEKLRWGFTPDPFIYAKWAERLDHPTDKAEHKWVTGVRGEEYLDPISDWNRTKPIWRKKWGIDNFSHETFKCMSEIALLNAYVIEREAGKYVGYNCKVKMKDGTLVVTPYEACMNRIHLNLKTPTQIKANVGKKIIKGKFKGMCWIGPGGIPEDICSF